MLALVLVLLAAGVAHAAEEACVPRAGDRRTVAVSVAPPEGGLVAGLTMIVDYPERKVVLPGSGLDVATDAIGGTPTGAVVGVNDLGHEVRIVLAGPKQLAPGDVVDLRFDACEGVDAVAADDFGCRVVDAADPATNLVRDVTCRARLR